MSGTVRQLIWGARIGCSLLGRYMNISKKRREPLAMNSKPLTL